MNHALVAMLALIATSSTALAGGSVHALVGLPTGETHTIDVTVNDDGTYTLLLDGAPVDPTALPGAPAIPSAPEVPTLPVVPGIPTLPTLP